MVHLQCGQYNAIQYSDKLYSILGIFYFGILGLAFLVSRFIRCSLTWSISKIQERQPHIPLFQACVLKNYENLLNVFVRCDALRRRGSVILSEP